MSITSFSDTLSSISSSYKLIIGGVKLNEGPITDLPDNNKL